MKRNANAMQTHQKRNADIDKDIDKNKKKNIKKKKFEPPTCQEVENYFFENGYTKESGKKAFEYYEAGNWTDSTGKPVINWKQKVRAVWFKDENKIKAQPKPLYPIHPMLTDKPYDD